MTSSSLCEARGPSASRHTVVSVLGSFPVPTGPLFGKFPYVRKIQFAFRMPAVSPEFPGENSICRNSPLGGCLCCPRFRSDAFYSPTPRARGDTESQSKQPASGSRLSPVLVSPKEAGS